MSPEDGTFFVPSIEALQPGVAAVPDKFYPLVPYNVYAHPAPPPPPPPPPVPTATRGAPDVKDPFASDVDFDAPHHHHPVPKSGGDGVPNWVALVLIVAVAGATVGVILWHPWRKKDK